MCGDERRPRDKNKEAENTAFKAAVCGMTQQTARRVATEVSAGAESCGKVNRGCDWDMRPGTRGLYLLDWWFLASSELADGFGRIWAGFENMTALIKTELVTEKKRSGAAARQASPLAGIWLFGHLYWGLHVFRTLRSNVQWAPLTMGVDYTLARMAKNEPVKCLPTAPQIAYGALSRSIAPLKVPPAFLPDGDTRPNFTDQAKHIVSHGVSPLVHACRHNSFGTGRIFKCPGTSAACKGREVADPRGTAATAGRFLEATKTLGHVSGCLRTGAHSLGGDACALALAALWRCMRLASASANCSNLLVPRDRVAVAEPKILMGKINHPWQQARRNTSAFRSVAK